MEQQELRPQAAVDELLETARALFGDAAGEQAEEFQYQINRRRSSDLKLAKQIRQTFASQHGQATLNWLMELTIRAPHPHIDELLAEKPENREFLSGARAGANDLVYLIADAINQANAAEGEN